ncbi:UNVERIFIED_CONTAM: hypothetical protein NCL1_36505 [Trichonephila clavipes]
MQYRTCVRNSACSFCNKFGVTDLHVMLIPLRSPSEKNSVALGWEIAGATLVDLRRRRMNAPKIVEFLCDFELSSN